MPETTKQMDEWMGDFGRNYTDRNAFTLDEFEAFFQKTFGITRAELNERFLGSVNRSARILEVGSNVGNQLLCLQRMGFTNLYGIELQTYAVELSKRQTQQINIIQGSAFDIPYKDGYFDLVFTSGVLIHLSPDDIGKALAEIHRATKKYIWGFEYWSEETRQVTYRGNENLLWKADYAGLYLKSFNDLKLIKEEKLKYLNDDNRDVMYLLEKKGH